MVKDISDEGLQRLAVAGQRADRGRQSDEGAGRRVQHVPRQHAAVVHRRRSREVQAAGHSAQRRLQRACRPSWAAIYVNDFNEFGRTWQVNLQAQADFRDQAAKVRRLEVRNNQGDMVPLGTLASVREFIGPHDGHPLQQRHGRPDQRFVDARHEFRPGRRHDGEAGRRASLDPTFTSEWTELTLQEKLAGNTALFIFPLCILFVFLTHAAEYESWSLPLAIILIVPMSLLCAVGRRGAARHGQQHLHADRLRDSGRAGV